MTADELRQQIRQITVWSSGGERAPHKPLLLLLALGRIRNGSDRWMRYAEVDPELTELLIAFGPPRRVTHPEYPFWRLQNDGLWEIPERSDVPESASGNVSRVLLLRKNVRGGFPDPVHRLLSARPDLVGELATVLIEAHFPESLHEDVLTAVGLDHLGESTTPRARDPRFREIVLRAYEYRCAVCGYHVRLGNALIGLDAAHIRWHQAGGPCTLENGLALCALHHKLFDRGAFTVASSDRILVSQEVHGFEGLEDLLLRFHGRPPRRPQGSSNRPAERHLGWHRNQVFRGPGRELPV